MTSKHQKFEYREVSRSEIKAAPYNPNQMDQKSMAALKANMESLGLVETLIWNERTGNLVGGHHRLETIDAIEGSKDYRLGVAAVKLTEKREVEMNVFLNNTQAQGHFDREKFFSMLVDDPGIRLESIGFTELDLKIEFGDDLPALPQLPDVPDFSASIKPRKLQPSKAAVSAAKSAGDVSVVDRKAAQESTLLVTFGSCEEKVNFLTKRKFPLGTDYINIHELMTA